MSSTQPTSRPGSAPAARRHRRRGTALLAAAVLCLVLPACTSGAEPAGPATSAGTSSTGTAGSAAADALTIDITIADGDVTPNGEKRDVAVGQPVVLRVTSDEDDEIHAHTGGEGYRLAVTAGEPATGTFTLTSPGSFEVESHHLEKVVVVLNAR